MLRKTFLCSCERWKLQLNPTWQLSQNHFLSLLIKYYSKNSPVLQYEVSFLSAQRYSWTIKSSFSFSKSFFSFKKVFLSLEFVPLRYWERTITCLLGLPFTWHTKAGFPSLLLNLPDQDYLSSHLFKTQSFLTMNGQIWTLHFKWDFLHFLYQGNIFFISLLEIVFGYCIQLLSLLASHQYFMVTLPSAALHHSFFSLISNW